MLDGTVTQHQMGEIQIPFMGRHIGALHHEAHVTEGACIHDFLEILAIEMLHILMLAFIDHIEKRGETVAQIEATAAAMTNIENPAQLCVQRRSEEHTSELQSLMRISYAVFCLKKKKRRKKK